MEKINQFYCDVDHDILTAPSVNLAVNDFLKGKAVVWVDWLTKAANEHVECVGLSMNQVWSSRITPCPAMFIAKISGEWKVFINPQIKGSGPKIKDEEGCLSRAGKKPKKVKRDKNVTIIYFDIHGECYTDKYTLMEARIIQHEYDHILGKIV